SVNAKVIIMDEPTAALSNRESEELYRITKQLRDNGVAIIFISHRMEDFDRLADRVTVLRDAKYIGTWNKDEIDHDRLVMAMVGREITQMFPKRNVEIGEEILKVEHLGRQGFFKDVSFSVRKGEIVALTGLVGAGRTEVCEAIYGITNFNEGKLYLNGEEVCFEHPNQAIEKGIGYLPEDRLGEGLILDWELYKNVSLSSLDRFSNKGIINISTEKEKTKELCENLMVKATSVFDRAATLSGGNQQKIVVAKLLTSDLKVIILDEPTKGVDVGAKTAIFNIMGDLAESGYGIIMISSEMVEVLGVSDRTVVMREGRVMAEFKTKEATQELLLNAALGTLKEEKHA
ncbi:MAG: sugar ABC transporter ATP-binding protein, partial [Peptostreptococcaceae bacterium]|nr:sugar ABC transporter ATP-binding protein [Peptostreptococcaceae bacterium]